MCSFFVVPGNRQPSLGKPDIEALGILTINCNTIESRETDSLENCKTNMRQEINATEKLLTNTDGSKFEIEDKPMVNDNNNNSIKYFLPGLNSDADKEASFTITQWLQREFKDVFNSIGCFDGTFPLQATPDSKPYQACPDVYHMIYNNHSNRN